MKQTTGKWKAIVVLDVIGKQPMEEGPLEEDAMEKDSPPCTCPDVEEDDEKLPHYVSPRRDEVEEVILLKKANTTLVMPWILENIPMPKSTISKILKLSFEEFDTQWKPRLKRDDCIILDQTDMTGTQILGPM